MSGPRPDEGGVPVYYYQAPKYRIFMRTADVQRTLRELAEESRSHPNPEISRRYVAQAEEVDKDQPLRDHTDLSHFALRDPYWDVPYLVSEMLRRGRASVGDQRYFKRSSTSAVAGQSDDLKMLRLYAWGDEAPVERKFCSMEGVEVFDMAYEILQPSRSSRDVK